MSTALSNLKRNKKVPLINRGVWRGRTAPFRQGGEAGDDDFLDAMNEGVKSKHHTKQSTGEALSDKELLSTVMKRLANAERELKDARITIKERDKRIKNLEEKCSILQKGKGHENGRIEELERLCLALQEQVEEMEGFLEDYGMIWVGKGDSSDSAANSKPEVRKKEQCTGESNELLFPHSGLWHQESACLSEFKVDFDQLAKNIQELNMLAGEGEHIIRHTGDGARLQFYKVQSLYVEEASIMHAFVLGTVRENVPLTLFANGLVMFDGPFRPYSDPETQQCILDLMDGYFPSELQERFPDGVPFKLVDNRGIHFRDYKQERLFPGFGRTLASKKETSEDFPDQGRSNGDNVSSDALGLVRETKDIPGRQKQTLDQFLRKLPASVVQKGRMVQVRSDIENIFMNSSESTEVQIIETETARQLRRTESDLIKKSSVSTLRIKSENGEKTYLLRMRADETIADLRACIDSQRSSDALPYIIRTTFPNKTYENDAMTLQECGFVPNATLHLTSNQH